MVKILTAIGPELAAAMNAENNSDIIKAIAEAVSPYALAKGESVADATNKLLRGTSIEELFHKKS